MQNLSNYASVVNKIDNFIKKYYLNKIIRGSIWLFSIFLVSYLVLIVTEYYIYFGVLFKTIIFYSFVAFQFILSYFLVAKYLLKYLKLGKVLDYQTASKIIGDHFPDIKDKLLNTLQLKHQSLNQSQNSLIEASINQKINALKPIPFVTAIKLNGNKKYIKYALIPIIIFLILAFAAPAIIKEGTNRIINHNHFFEPPAPFSFTVLNKNLFTSQGNDFVLNLKIQGKQMPQDVYLETGTNVFKLDKKTISNFVYQFRNLQKNHKFRFKAAGFYSKEFEIIVLQKPTILNFELSLKYPIYTKKQNQVIKNPSDITLPTGTTLTWKLQTQHATKLNFILGNKNILIAPLADNLFMHQQRITTSNIYSFLPLNNKVANADKISYQLNCIADEYPIIDFNTMPDSINPKVVYFNGKITDDYGFKALNFNFKIIKSNQKTLIGLRKIIPIKIKANSVQNNFFYFWDLNSTNIQAGDELEYFFSVTDNDGVNGPKTTKSTTKTYKINSKDELIKQIEEGSKNLTKKIQQAANQAKQIQQEAQKINQELLSKTKLDFEDKKNAQQLIEKQHELEKLLKDIQTEAKKNKLAQAETNPNNQKLLEKQKQIEDLFNNVLDDKTRKLLEELQKLIDKNNKNELQEGLKQTKADNKTLEKEFDRMLALYKQLELDQKLDNAVNKLKELAQKQNDLSKQTEQNKLDGMQQKQQELRKNFDDVKKDLKDLEQKSKENTPKQEFKNPETQQNQIDKELQQVQKSLEQKQQKSAAKQQKAAAQQMESLSKKLSDMQTDMDEQAADINLQALRTLLKNTLKASFDEENILNLTQKTDINDAKFIQLGKSQKNIGLNLKTIQDSLFSLSKLVPQITKAVNKETQNINTQLTKTLEYITERKQSETLKSQQYVLTAINNLALMLNDALIQMQKPMGESKQGKGKPKPSMGQLSKMQQQLNKNMQKAKQQLEQKGGEKPGQKPGEKQGQGIGSKEFAQMAQQQQMIRQAMEELNKNGTKMPGGFEKILQNMKQTETDLVYKRITQEVLQRQQQIESKLLEAATAQREKEQDTEKQSFAPKPIAPNYNFYWQAYKKQQQTDLEIIKTISPKLNYFYKQKITTYNKNINLSR